MNNHRRRMGTALLAASLAHCGLRQLPAYTTPGHELVRINNAPGGASEGEGQVAIDVVDGPAQVSIPTGSSSARAVGTHGVAVADEENVRICVSRRAW